MGSIILSFIGLLRGLKNKVFGVMVFSWGLFFFSCIGRREVRRGEFGREVERRGFGVGFISVYGLLL